MGQVLEFKPRQTFDDEEIYLYSEEYIIQQYELYWQEELEHQDEEAWQRGRDFLANQLVQDEQKELNLLKRLAKKLFA